MTKIEIARHLRVDPAAVTRWHRRGMPVNDPQAAAEWHSSNIRPRRRRDGTAAASAPAPAPAPTPAGDPATRSWRDRLDRANAQTRELELARVRGDLLDARKVAQAIDGRQALIAQRMKAIPRQVAIVLRGRVSGAVERAVVAEVARILHGLLREIQSSPRFPHD